MLDNGRFLAAQRLCHCLAHLTILLANLTILATLYNILRDS